MELNRSTLKALNLPRPIQVTADADGKPVSVDGNRVEQIRDSWRICDGWWMNAELHREYFAVVTENGAFVTIFRDLLGDRWYWQRAQYQ